MFCTLYEYISQTFIQTYWAKVDKPTNKRLIQTILDSENIRLNGLAAQGIIHGGRVEFREKENPTTTCWTARLNSIPNMPFGELVKWLIVIDEKQKSAKNGA